MFYLFEFKCKNSNVRIQMFEYKCSNSKAKVIPRQKLLKCNNCSKAKIVENVNVNVTDYGVDEYCCC